MLRVFKSWVEGMFTIADPNIDVLWMTTREYAYLHNLELKEVYHLIQTGAVKAHKENGRWIIDLTEKD